MSSPIHQPEDLDEALRYAPPWAREKAPRPELSSGPPIERPPRLQRDAWQPSFSGDRAMMELRRQLAMCPDDIPDPPSDIARNLWPIVLRMCGVTGFAAVVAWAMISVPGTKQSGAETAQFDAPPPVAANRVKLVHFRSAGETLPPPVVDGFSEPDPPQQQATTAPVPPPQPQAPQPVKSAPTLDNGEIATLVKRGEELLQNGDLASARLLLQRAAESGNASAALALGSSYDPLLIQQLGVIGIKPDAARAREWYQRAVELGSETASQHLANLDRSK
jgi:hypothetical protein